MACVDAGLTIERLGEHREGYWDALPHIPPDELKCIPQTFSLMARRP